MKICTQRSRPLYTALSIGMLFFFLLTSGGTTQAQAHKPLELVVLGSGGPGATGRASSAFLLLVGGKARILIDAGPGSFVRLGEAKLNLRDLDIVLLTHLHVDHTAELPAIIKARAVSHRTDLNFRIFGPGELVQKHQPAIKLFPSTSQFIELLFGKNGAFPYLSDFVGQIRFDVQNVQFSGAKAKDSRIIYQHNGLTIRAAQGHHGKTPAIMYRIEYRNKSITFTGDIDKNAHPASTRLARQTDLLVFNTVLLDPPQSPRGLYTLHSAPVDIGTVAGTAGARNLLLAHIPSDVEVAFEEVKKSIKRHYDGPVSLAQDGMWINP
jgi:ribonuclease BN (tRNA processing enzyme)